MFTRPLRSASLATVIVCGLLVAACGSSGSSTTGSTSTASTVTSTVSGTVVEATNSQMQLVDGRGFDHTLSYGTPGLESTAKHYLASQGPVKVTVRTVGKAAAAMAITAGPNPYAGLAYRDGTPTAVSATAITLRTADGTSVAFVVTAKNLTALDIPALHNQNLTQHIRTRIYYVRAGSKLDARGYLNLGS